MAIDFLQAKKQQRYLILILALVIFAILIIVWQGFFKAPAVSLTPLATPALPQKVIINWSTLQAPQLKELQVFEEISPFEGEIGRENPFIPY